MTEPASKTTDHISPNGPIRCYGNSVKSSANQISRTHKRLKSRIIYI